MKKNATKDLKNFIYTELLIQHNGFTHISNWSDGYKLFPIPNNAEIIETRSEVVETIDSLKSNSFTSQKMSIKRFENDFDKSKRFIIYTGTPEDLEKLRNQKYPITVNNIKLYVIYLMNLKLFNKVVQFSQIYSIQNIIQDFSITDKDLSNKILDTINNPIQITEQFPFLKI